MTCGAFFWPVVFLISLTVLVETFQFLRRFRTFFSSQHAAFWRKRPSKSLGFSRSGLWRKGAKKRHLNFLGVSGSAPVDLMSMDGGLLYLVPVVPLALLLLMVTLRWYSRNIDIGDNVSAESSKRRPKTKQAEEL